MMASPAALSLRPWNRGEIAVDRLQSFHQLRAELKHLERQNDPRMASEYKNEIKKIHRAQKQKYKMSRKP